MRRFIALSGAKFLKSQRDRSQWPVGILRSYRGDRGRIHPGRKEDRDRYIRDQMRADTVCQGMAGRLDDFILADARGV